ncbi:MAG: hypothetical protein ACI4GW_03435 [Lachnospiraceae bacterium]
MNSYFTLTKTFIAAIGMSKAQDKRRKIMIVILSIFAVFGVLLPVSLGVGMLVKLMTETLMPLGCQALGIQLMFHVICIFTVIFGISIVFNEFFFSNDIEYLLPWPLRAYQIVAAKFTATFYNENIMQFILVLSCIIGYGIGSKMGIFNWILSVIGVITLPILPLAYCGILSLIVMGFTRIIRNKDIIQRISVILIFALVLILVGSIGFLQNMDIDTYVETLASGDQTFFNVMNIVFPNVPLFVKTFSEGSLLALLEYIIINAVAVAVLLLLAEGLYFKGVIGLTSSPSAKKTKSLDYLLNHTRQHSQSYAYFLKELRILLRTPVFFTNCIAINFIWPIFAYAMYKLQSNPISLQQLQEAYARMDIRIQLIFLLGIIGVSVIVSALNSLSSNSISREGKHFSFMKYIPVPYETQWNVKVFIGVLFPILGVWIYFIPFCILVKVPVIHIFMYLFLSLMSVTFVSFMGIYIDSIQPKLIWDDELSALRENYNTFFSMAISIAFTVIVCVGGFFLFCKTEIAIVTTALIMVIILAAANIVALALTYKSSVRNIEEQEEA